jgi:hypothetical protein
MKHIFTTAALILISTAAIAGNSDRYNDLRLDTRGASNQSYADTRQTVTVVLSTRDGKNVGTAGEGYIYGGFGPNNDSR